MHEHEVNIGIKEIVLCFISFKSKCVLWVSGRRINLFQYHAVIKFYSLITFLSANYNYKLCIIKKLIARARFDLKEKISGKALIASIMQNQEIS